MALGAAHADTLTGRVVGVTDGDTITVLDADRQQHKIRLGGIDAPEKAQPFGQRSRRICRGWCSTRRCGSIGPSATDTSGIVRTVWVLTLRLPDLPDDARCRSFVDYRGLAWWYRKYANEQPSQDRGQYEFSEQEAKAKRVGLWSEPDPVPPWDGGGVSDCLEATRHSVTEC